MFRGYRVLAGEEQRRPTMVMVSQQTVHLEMGNFILCLFYQTKKLQCKNKLKVYSNIVAYAS